MNAAASYSGHDISPALSGSIRSVACPATVSSCAREPKTFVLAVVLVVELAQDLRELLGADLAPQLVPDLLEGELGAHSRDGGLRRGGRGSLLSAEPHCVDLLRPG
jgi:hypothetical protein